MTHHDLIILLAGSFLPNDLLKLLFKSMFRRPIKHYDNSVKHRRLISPRRYYAKFQSDPKTQYAYHRKMQLFWLAGFIPMNLLVAVDIWAALTNHVALALVMNAVILAINTNDSQYANFATETGDAHAAYASIKADEIQETAADLHTTLVIPEPVLQEVGE